MRLLGIYDKALAPIMARLTKSGIKIAGSRLLEVTAWVLVTSWWVALAVWVWVGFSPWAAMP